MVIKPNGQHQKADAARQRVEHLLPGVELQMFLVARSHTNQQDGRHLAVHQVPIVVDKPRLHTVMHVTHDAVPMVKHRRVDGVHEELHQHRHVHNRPEYLISPLQFLAFFHLALSLILHSSFIILHYIA